MLRQKSDNKEMTDHFFIQFGIRALLNVILILPLPVM